MLISPNISNLDIASIVLEEEEFDSFNSSSTKRKFIQNTYLYRPFTKIDEEIGLRISCYLSSFGKKSSEIENDDNSGSRIAVKDLFSDYGFLSEKEVLQKRLLKKYEGALEIAESYQSDIPNPVQFLSSLFNHKNISEEIIKEIIDEPYG